METYNLPEIGMDKVKNMKKKSNLNFERIGQNISILMDACSIDATELSQQTGLPCSTISRLRSNTTEFSPNLSSLIPIAEFFRVTLSQLIGEEPISNEVHGTFRSSKIKKLPIPILNSENILDYLNSNQINNAPLIDIDLILNENAFAYFVQGNAMEPQFPDNTLLIIDPNLEAENLDHVLVLPYGKKTPIFRQILIDGEDKYLRTLNPTFNEFIKITNDSYKILGVTVQSQRNFKNVNSRSNTESNKKQLSLVG